MKIFPAFLLLLAIVSSCKKDEIFDIVKPKEYFPAFPGSYWTYSNGERSLVYPEYVEHSYELSINSTARSEKKWVPKIDNNYVYEYEITQSSTVYPLKMLLSETKNDPWIVDEIEGDLIMRETIQSIDSIYLKFPSDEVFSDSVIYKNILVVVEYNKNLGKAKWNTKEYYSKDVGLIRSEINNPYDTLPAIVQKQLLNYYINK